MNKINFKILTSLIICLVIIVSTIEYYHRKKLEKIEVINSNITSYISEHKFIQSRESLNELKTLISENSVNNILKNINLEQNKFVENSINDINDAMLQAGFETSLDKLKQIKPYIEENKYNKINSSINIVSNIYQKMYEENKFDESIAEINRNKGLLTPEMSDILIGIVSRHKSNLINDLKSKITKDREFKEKGSILDEIKKYTSEKEYKEIKNELDRNQIEYSKKVIIEINKNIKDHEYDIAMGKLVTIKEYFKTNVFEKNKIIIENNKKNYQKKLNKTRTNVLEDIYNNFSIGGCVVSRRLIGQLGEVEVSFNGTIIDFQDSAIEVRIEDSWEPLGSIGINTYHPGNTYKFLQKELFHVPCDLSRADAFLLLNKIGLPLTDFELGYGQYKEDLSKFKASDLNRRALGY